METPAQRLQAALDAHAAVTQSVKDEAARIDAEKFGPCPVEETWMSQWA
jgi:hypothetical protein